jgi:DNA-binding MarR family transcriptional regulator
MGPLRWSRGQAPSGRRRRCGVWDASVAITIACWFAAGVGKGCWFSAVALAADREATHPLASCPGSDLHGSIWIDDGCACGHAGSRAGKGRDPVGGRGFGRLFEQAYLRFHRRDAKRSQLSGASRAVLLHLVMAGPLTVGEAAGHPDRAQSVVGDIVTQLEGKGLLERQMDPADRRRTLVWLTPHGFLRLEHDRDVLGRQQVERAMRAMGLADRPRLLAGLRALLAADDRTGPTASAPPSVPAGSADVEEVTETEGGRGDIMTGPPAPVTTHRTPAATAAASPSRAGGTAPTARTPRATQSLPERFERMVAWQVQRDPAASRDQVEAATRGHMATMPAWRDHPAVSGT